MRVVLAIDPGQDKCGIAVVYEKALIEKKIVPREECVGVIQLMINQHHVEIIVIGDGTGSAKLRKELLDIIPLPIIIYPEAYTTIKARKRYFVDNPPKGFRRFIPVGLLLPNQPYDDYAALIIAEEYFKAFKQNDT